MGEWASLKFKICSSCLIFTINIAILVIGILLIIGQSNYFGILIRMETEDWNRSPIISIVNPSENGFCPNDTETITGTFSGINERCNYING